MNACGDRPSYLYASYESLWLQPLTTSASYSYASLWAQAQGEAAGLSTTRVAAARDTLQARACAQAALQLTLQGGADPEQLVSGIGIAM